MPLFEVRLYHGLDRPARHPQNIVAADAHRAAEKASGERLDSEKGALDNVRAVVQLPDGEKQVFYTTTLP